MSRDAQNNIVLQTDQIPDITTKIFLINEIADDCPEEIPRTENYNIIQYKSLVTLQPNLFSTIREQQVTDGLLGNSDDADIIDITNPGSGGGNITGFASLLQNDKRRSGKSIATFETDGLLNSAGIFRRLTIITSLSTLGGLLTQLNTSLNNSLNVLIESIIGGGLFAGGSLIITRNFFVLNNRVTINQTRPDLFTIKKVKNEISLENIFREPKGSPQFAVDFYKNNGSDGAQLEYICLHTQFLACQKGSFFVEFENPRLNLTSVSESIDHMIYVIMHRGNIAHRDVTEQYTDFDGNGKTEADVDSGGRAVLDYKAIDNENFLVGVFRLSDVVNAKDKLLQIGISGREDSSTQGFFAEKTTGASNRNITLYIGMILDDFRERPDTTVFETDKFSDGNNLFIKIDHIFDVIRSKNPDPSDIRMTVDNIKIKRTEKKIFNSKPYFPGQEGFIDPSSGEPPRLVNWRFHQTSGTDKYSLDNAVITNAVNTSLTDTIAAYPYFYVIGEEKSRRYGFGPIGWAMEVGRIEKTSLEDNMILRLPAFISGFGYQFQSAGVESPIQSSFDPTIKLYRSDMADSDFFERRQFFIADREFQNKIKARDWRDSLTLINDFGKFSDFYTNFKPTRETIATQRITQEGAEFTRDFDSFFRADNGEVPIHNEMHKYFTITNASLGEDPDGGSIARYWLISSGFFDADDTVIVNTRQIRKLALLRPKIYGFFSSDTTTAAKTRSTHSIYFGAMIFKSPTIEEII